MFVTSPSAPPRNFAPCIVAISQSSTRTTNQNASEQSAPQLKCWERIAAQLPAKDVESEWYNLKEIAPLLGIKPRSLAKHCRDLWPNWEGHYRLNYSQAISLIRRVCYAGKKVPR